MAKKLRYRNIHTSIWDDPDFEDCSFEEISFFIWCFSNGRTNMIGAYEVTLRQICFDLHLPLNKEGKAKVQGFIKKLEEIDKIKYFPEKNILWIKNFAIWQNLMKGTTLIALCEDLKSLPVNIITEIKDWYSKRGYPIDTLSKKTDTPSKKQDTLSKKMDTPPPKPINLKPENTPPPTPPLPGGESLEIHTAEELITAISSLEIQGDAKTEINEFLVSQGFEVQINCPVPDRGDGRRGKIAMLASRGKLQVALEINGEECAEKSIFKLHQVRKAKKIILLRNGECDKPPKGIDYVISLNCPEPGSRLSDNPDDFPLRHPFASEYEFPERGDPGDEQYFIAGKWRDRFQTSDWISEDRDRREREDDTPKYSVTGKVKKSSNYRKKPTVSVGSVRASPDDK